MEEPSPQGSASGKAEPDNEARPCPWRCRTLTTTRAALVASIQGPVQVHPAPTALDSRCSLGCGCDAVFTVCDATCCFESWVDRQARTDEHTWSVTYQHPPRVSLLGRVTHQYMAIFPDDPHAGLLLLRHRAPATSVEVPVTPFCWPTLVVVWRQTHSLAQAPTSGRNSAWRLQTALVSHPWKNAPPLPRATPSPRVKGSSRAPSVILPCTSPHKGAADPTELAGSLGLSWDTTQTQRNVTSLAAVSAPGPWKLDTLFDDLRQMFAVPSFQYSDTSGSGLHSNSTGRSSITVVQERVTCREASKEPYKTSAQKPAPHPTAIASGPLSDSSSSDSLAQYLAVAPRGSFVFTRLATHMFLLLRCLSDLRSLPRDWLLMLM